MRTDPTPEPGDRDEVPFSDGTEWDTWSANVCGAGKGCIHDSTYGQADDEMPAEVNCPLITIALYHVWPHEWARREVTTKYGSYTVAGECSEYAEDFPEPVPEPGPITVDLFGTYAEEPAT
jgi:hypothetical protein